MAVVSRLLSNAPLSSDPLVSVIKLTTEPVIRTACVCEIHNDELSRTELCVCVEYTFTF